MMLAVLAALTIVTAGIDGPGVRTLSPDEIRARGFETTRNYNEHGKWVSTTRCRDAKCTTRPRK